MNDKSRMKRIEKAQVRVLFTVPFFASGVAKLPVEFRDDVATACTNGERIVFGRKFLDGLKDEEIVTILCHEVAHCMLGHLWRAPVGVKWDIWNQATDHAINTMLMEFSKLVVKGGKYADPFPWPAPPPGGAYCADPQFAGMAEEVIYAKLASNQPPGGGGGGQSRSKGQGGAKASGLQGGSLPDLGQIEQPQDGSSQTSSKQLLNDWTATLLQAAKIAKGRGDLPGSMEGLIDDIISPKLDWTEILRSWLREQSADDWNCLEPATEYEGSGFMLPSLKSEKMGPVVFGSDWSGSTCGELVSKFHGEKQGCLDEMRPSKLVDIGFDTKVQWEKEYLPGDQIDRRTVGHGGTSFVDVLKRCAELNPPPKCVVILTDLDGEFPSEAPPFPIVWIAYNTKSKAPFGDTIYAD